jgi:hypothetical protein
MQIGSFWEESSFGNISPQPHPTESNVFSREWSASYGEMGEGGTGFTHWPATTLPDIHSTQTTPHFQ